MELECQTKEYPIIGSEPDTERIDRFQALQAGQFWRALQSIPDEGIDEGTVLLIQSIRWVDDAPHTIILRPHPSKIGTRVSFRKEDGTLWTLTYDEHRFLLKDFLSQFEHEPEHQSIRNSEVSQVQGRINALQTELLEAQSNPALLARVVEGKLREQSEQNTEGTAVVPASAQMDQRLACIATGTVANAIGTGITTEVIASLKQAAGREHQIATIKSQWIQEKTGEIASTIKSLTPYYEEQAAAALAQTEDVRTYAAKLVEGIASLDLYVGRDVEVTTIREGEAAPSDQPLTFVQRKLMMDEELAAWTDIDEWFDFSKENLFFEALRKHDGLVRQIFPTERCVLVMAATRRFVDYGVNPAVDVLMNIENRKVFLLVRNGMNVYKVVSPVEAHLGTARLFPSRDEQDSIFRGWDGRQIKFEDITYSDRLAEHEKFALHYKRFLLLACGLDHRLKLFGDFYPGPPSLDFVSLDFQEKYCRFLHDDDGTGLLSDKQRPSLEKWIKEKNAYLCSGSRVLCNWKALMDPATAPAACYTFNRGDGNQRGFGLRYNSSERMSVAIAYRGGKSLYVDVAVSGETRDFEDRSFNCKVKLVESEWEHYNEEQPFLCLDAVQPEELHWYIYNRDARSNHLFYIRFFKHALKFLKEERDLEQDTRRRLAQALADGAIATGDEASAIIQQAVIAWRASHRGKPLPRFENGIAPAAWKSLLDQMYILAGEGQRRTEEAAAFVTELGYTPLRLVLSGKGKLAIYAAPSLSELDNRVEPHAWVHRITIERGKTRFLEKSRRWAILPKVSASETTLHQWPETDAWIDKATAFPSFERKQDLLALATSFAEHLKPFLAPMDADTHACELARWNTARNEMLSESKFMFEPTFVVPFGMVYSDLYGIGSKTLRFLCVGCSPHVLLYRLAPDEASRERVHASFVRPYYSKSQAQERFQKDVSEAYPWKLCDVSVSLADSRFGNFAHGQAGVGLAYADGKNAAEPLLGQWFDNLRKDLDRKDVRYWIADEALDEDGKLIFDRMLGIRLPEDYAPVDVVEIILDRPLPSGFDHWYDICPHGAKYKDLETDEIRRIGRNSRTFSQLSPEQARSFIQSRAATYKGKMAQPATGEVGRAAPQGVERWVVLPIERFEASHKEKEFQHAG